jgi:rSAM/selenodomain-associated transferase 2
MTGHPPLANSLADMSLVIPTLNAGETLAACLASIREAHRADVVVVDGGSTDGTLAIARAAGARVLAAPCGRGAQLRAGAAAAGRPWLLVLHADTRLQPGWAAAVAAYLERPDAAEGFAVFRFRLDAADWQARRLEDLVALRVRWLRLPYGDQGLLIHRDLYAGIGGYAPMPLMEDVDLVRRLGRRPLTVLTADAVTSAARWRRDGWLRSSARNLVCLGLFELGVPPHRIARFYGL